MAKYWDREDHFPKASFLRFVLHVNQGSSQRRGLVHAVIRSSVS